MVAGATATARIGTDALTGTAGAGGIVVAGSFSEKGGTRVVSQLALQPSGDTFTGTMSWSFQRGTAQCTGTSVLEGRDLALPAPPAGPQLLKVNLHESTDVVYVSVPADGSATMVGVQQSSAGDFVDVLGSRPAAGKYSLTARNGARVELQTQPNGTVFGMWTNPRTSGIGSADAVFLTTVAAETFRFVQARSCAAVLGDGVPYHCREAQSGSVLCPQRAGFLASDAPCPSTDAIGYCPAGATALGAGLRQPYTDLLYASSEMLRVRSRVLNTAAYKYFDALRQECRTSRVDMVPRLDRIRSCRRVFQGSLLFCRDRFSGDLTGVKYAEGFDVVECPLTDATYQATDTYCPTPDRWRICPGGTFLGGSGVLVIKFDNDIWYRPAFEIPVSGGQTFAALTLGSCPANRLYDVQALARQAATDASGAVDTSWGGISRLEFESDGIVLPPPPPLSW